MKPKFDKYLSHETKFGNLCEVEVSSFWTEIPPEIANLVFCRDKCDDMLILAALASFSPRLVTGNRDLLEVAAISGLMIITRTDALNHAQFV